MTWVKHGKTLVTFAGHIVTAAVIFSIVGLGVCGLHKMSELFASLGIGELYVLVGTQKSLQFGPHSLQFLTPKFATDGASET